MPLADKLYDHNRQALEGALSLWESGSRYAAVIHPTGTGKSLIYHALAEQAPGGRVLVLSPTNHIFEAQKSAVLKLEPGYDFDAAYEKRTYTINYNASQRREDLGEWDYIVLDEYHRAGADTWEVGVRSLLAANPHAHVLGLSATPVRALDGARDMTTELLEGNVASEITIPEALAEGLLPVPRYIVGDYSVNAEIAEYERRIDSMSPGERKADAERTLQAMRRNVADRGLELDRILGDNIANPDSKLIVFCRNIAALEETRARASELFGRVNGNIRTYALHSGDSADDGALEAFDADNEPGLKLLLCVNAINEGVHPGTVDGVVMLRPTESYNVYIQQLGRALSASKTADKPLVIDIVDNLSSAGFASRLADDYGRAAQAKQGRKRFTDAPFRNSTDELEEFIINDKRLEFQELSTRLDDMLNSVHNTLEKNLSILEEPDIKEARNKQRRNNALKRVRRIHETHPGLFTPEVLSRINNAGFVLRAQTQENRAISALMNNLAILEEPDIQETENRQRRNNATKTVRNISKTNPSLFTPEIMKRLARLDFELHPLTQEDRVHAALLRNLSTLENPDIRNAENKAKRAKALQRIRNINETQPDLFTPEIMERFEKTGFKIQSQMHEGHALSELLNDIAILEGPDIREVQNRQKKYNALRAIRRTHETQPDLFTPEIMERFEKTGFKLQSQTSSDRSLIALRNNLETLEAPDIRSAENKGKRKSALRQIRRAHETQPNLFTPEIMERFAKTGFELENNKQRAVSGTCSEAFSETNARAVAAHGGSKPSVPGKSPGRSGHDGAAFGGDASRAVASAKAQAQRPVINNPVQRQAKQQAK